MQQDLYAHGKLLISGEYLVLKGAMALAIPTRYGQHLHVSAGDPKNNSIRWTARTDTGAVWLDLSIRKQDLAVTQVHTGDQQDAARAQEVLRAIRKMRPDHLTQEGETILEHVLEFPRDWGLGSSSTMLYNMARHAGVDAFALNTQLFNGSGYDIACAGSNWPILFKTDDEGPVFDTVHFMPPAPEQLLFVHLGVKQNSRIAVDAFLAQEKNFAHEIEIISEISEALLFCDDAEDFIQLLDEHEELMQYVLQEEKIKTQRFPDFPGSIKSLGAWGGDFILAAAPMEPAELQKYFTTKGYTTTINYMDMMLK